MTLLSEELIDPLNAELAGLVRAVEKGSAAGQRHGAADRPRRRR